MSEYTILKCNKCHILLVEEVKSEVLYDERFFQSSKYYDTFAQNRENERRIKILSNFVTPNACVLDMGCASGEFVHYAKNSFDIYGCDLSEDAIKVARKRFSDVKDRLFVHSATKESSQGNIYDAVCMWDVIEHIPYPMQAVEEAIKK